MANGFLICFESNLKTEVSCLVAYNFKEKMNPGFSQKPKRGLLWHCQPYFYPSIKLSKGTQKLCQKETQNKKFKFRYIIQIINEYEIGIVYSSTKTHFSYFVWQIFDMPHKFLQPAKIVKLNHKSLICYNFGFTLFTQVFEQICCMKCSKLLKIFRIFQNFCNFFVGIFQICLWNSR